MPIKKVKGGYKGWFYDHVTKKMYRWEDFMRLLKRRND